jgi:pimeloyl-ACP methyl ester carboxylesterase
MDGQRANDNGHRTSTGGQSRANTMFENINGKVDWQVGVLNGDVHNYDVNTTAPAGERFEKAVKLLDGNMARRAEELIRGAVEDGYRSNRVAYYWALSVLSGRQFVHLKGEDHETLHACFGAADSGNSDEWLAALSVIKEFLNCCIRYQRGKIRNRDYDELIQAYDDLGQDRREELRRHLDLIMTGALQDQLDMMYAVEIEQNRVAGDRTGRAWKFFEATPAEPQAETLYEPRIGVVKWFLAGLGFALVAAGLLLVLISSLRHGVAVTLGLIAGIGGGGYLLARTGRRWLIAREQVAADDDRYGGFSEPWKTAVDLKREGIKEPATMFNAGGRRQHPKPSPGRRYRLPCSDDEARDDDDGYEWGEDDEKDKERRRLQAKRRSFRFLVASSVNSRFTRERPSNGENNREKWRQDTKGLRDALASDYKRRYAQSGIAPNQLHWLMTWHAKQAKERWKRGALREDRESARRAAPRGGLVLLWAAAVGTGLVLGLTAAFAAGILYGLAAAVALGLGGCVGLAAKMDVFVVGCGLYRAESEMAGRRHQAELDEWRRWRGVLADRPTDAEIARWLDYDKVYIKNEVMKELGLVNRDVMAHAVLTEGRHLSIRAREVFGPARYSDYQVTVILLTDRGVAKITKNLDFRKGELTPGEREKVFSYDAISSADIVRVEVTFDGDHRTVIELDEDDASEQEPDTTRQAFRSNAGDSAKGRRPPADPDRDSGQQGKSAEQVVFGQSLRLSLNNGNPVDFVVENFDVAFLDEERGENVKNLFDITMDISGMRSAQRMLRAIAMSTREWITIEAQKREERLLDFREVTNASPAEEQESTTGTPMRQTAVPFQDGVIDVPVPGGILAVELASGMTAPVLVIHGLISQRRQWNWLRNVRPDLSLIMPDLRGRGESHGVTGSSSLSRHAEDMVAILDKVGLDSVLVCGVSMGAVVAVEMAIAHPSRVRGLALVDGGFPTATGSRLTPEVAPDIFLGLTRTRTQAWPSVFEYAQSATGKLSPLLSPFDLSLIDCLQHDLDPHGIRRLNCDMLHEDAASVLRQEQAWEHLRVPAWLLTAEWGTGAGTAPAYTPAAIKSIRQQIESPLTVQQVRAVDHASAIMSLTGAQAVAELIAETTS